MYILTNEEILNKELFIISEKTNLDIDILMNNYIFNENFMESSVKDLDNTINSIKEKIKKSIIKHKTIVSKLESKTVISMDKLNNAIKEGDVDANGNITLINLKAVGSMDTTKIKPNNILRLPTQKFTVKRIIDSHKTIFKEYVMVYDKLLQNLDSNVDKLELANLSKNEPSNVLKKTFMSPLKKKVKNFTKVNQDLMFYIYSDMSQLISTLAQLHKKGFQDRELDHDMALYYKRAIEAEKAAARSSAMGAGMAVGMNM